MRIVDLDDVVQITSTVCKAAFESLGNIDSVFCDVEGVATVRVANHKHWTISAFV